MKKSIKRIVSLAAAGVLALSCLAGCGGTTEGNGNGGSNDKVAFDKDFKVGLICLHDENSTYDLNFINSLEAAKKSLGLSDDQIIIKKNNLKSPRIYNIYITRGDFFHECGKRI